jgi:malate/lactate dehydrogenase
VCAGAEQRDLLDAGEAPFGKNRLIGSAPEALASAMRALVALETNGSVHDIALTVLGVPPAHVIALWEDATIAGFSATKVLDEPARRRLAARMPLLWPPGPYALAAAATEAIAAITGYSRRTLSCFVAAPEDLAGLRARAAALPVRLGRDGVERVEIPTLSATARVALDNGMLL